MSKLRLKVDDLAVESFATGDAGELQGTVKGRMDYTPIQPGACPPYQNTDPASCNCPTEYRCAYPSTSCGETETYDAYTCRCLYPPTDWHLCGCGGTDDSGGAMC
jgi:hypothetical protein